MNLSTKQKQTHRHREQTCGCQKRERDGLGVWGWQMQTITFRMDKQSYRKTDKMKRQRAMYQMKEQDKTPEKQLNEGR